MTIQNFNYYKNDIKAVLLDTDTQLTQSHTLRVQQNIVSNFNSVKELMKVRATSKPVNKPEKVKIKDYGMHTKSRLEKTNLFRSIQEGSSL